MTRFRWARALGLIGLSAALASPGASGQGLPASDARQELRFLRGLRERGYYDLAVEYIDDLRKNTATPADLKTILDYEEGRGLLEEAAHLGDLDRRAAELERARAKIDAFTKAHPDHELVPEALVQVARILYERGLTAELVAREMDDKDPGKQARLAEARKAFGEARAAYDRARDPLQKTYERLKGFIPEGDPRRELRDRSLAGLMDAMLQRGVVDYEEAQTYPPKSAQRKELLDKAVVHFEALYRDYRTQLAGLYARMWQAKCYEEEGELRNAMGIYKELTDHRAAELADLQRKVRYFQIVVDGKRGEHALAVDQADAWLRDYRAYRMSDDGAGVQFEKARNLLAQLDTMRDAEKEAAVRVAVELLQQVVRTYSPVKAEAVDLLSKYRPKSQVNPAQIAGLSYENASAEADTAMQTKDWDRAVALWEQAIRRADPTKKIDDVNKARYQLALTFYLANRFYESEVVAEHLARRYPKYEQSPKAAEMALSALVQAYDDNNQVDRSSDLDHLVALAKSTAETWPDADVGDYARTLLAEIEMGRGRYPDAWAAYESIRPESSRYLDAKVKAGDAHWRQSLLLRQKGQTEEADAEAAKAQELLSAALKARQDAGASPTDAGLLTNLNALAEVHRANGRPKDALALLEPEAKALAGAGGLSAEVMPLYEGLLTVLLKSHIATGQPNKAIDDMKALEQAGGDKAKLTRLYFELSNSLQKEMEEQRARKDPAFGRTRQAFQQFLGALANSQSGQDYQSLMFAAESMLGLGMAKESAEVFRRVLKAYADDKEFLAVTGSSDRLLRAHLRLAEALRKGKQFAEAQEELDGVKKANPKLIEPMMEQGKLLEDWARAEPKRWNDAYNYWRNLARRIEPVRALKLDYYEAIYHVAVALDGLGRKREAVGTLKSVMTLSPTVGNAEMKKKYQDLLATLGR